MKMDVMSREEANVWAVAIKRTLSSGTPSGGRHTFLKHKEKRNVSHQAEVASHHVDTLHWRWADATDRLGSGRHLRAACIGHAMRAKAFLRRLGQQALHLLC